MTTSTLEREGGIAKLVEANVLIQKAIESSKGSFKIKMEVGVINDMTEELCPLAVIPRLGYTKAWLYQGHMPWLY